MLPSLYIPELVYTPFNNRIGRRSYLQKTKCADFEYRFGRCLDAYGVQAYQNQCQDYYTDLMECIYASKQNQRCKLMLLEKNKKSLLGTTKQYDDIPEIYERSY